jgi:hypothetical protein
MYPIVCVRHYPVVRHYSAHVVRPRLDLIGQFFPVCHPLFSSTL